MRFMLQITVNQEPGEEWTDLYWPYQRDMVVTDALRSVAHEIGSRLECLKDGDTKRIHDRSSGRLIGEWKAVDE